MFSNWVEYINEFKSLVLTDRKQLNQSRLSLL